MKLLELGSMFEAMQRDGGPDVAPVARVILNLIREAVIKDALERPPSRAFLSLMAEHGYKVEDALLLREIVWKTDT